MLLSFLEGPDLLIVLVVLLVIFGGAQLPKLARSLGEAKRELDHGLRDEPSTEGDKDKAEQTLSAAQSTLATPSVPADTSSPRAAAPSVSCPCGGGKDFASCHGAKGAQS